MRVKHIRQHQDDKVTTGDWFNGDVRLCSTLERPWKFNQENISCIPEGIYKVVKVMSPRFKRMIWRLQDVPNRTNVEIHFGNTIKDTEGCILVGANINNTVFRDKKTGEVFTPWIDNSLYTLDMLDKFLPDTFELEITCKGFNNKI